MFLHLGFFSENERKKMQANYLVFSYLFFFFKSHFQQIKILNFLHQLFIYFHITLQTCRTKIFLHSSEIIVSTVRYIFHIFLHVFIITKSAFYLYHVTYNSHHYCIKLGETSFLVQNLNLVLYNFIPNFLPLSC